MSRLLPVGPLLVAAVGPKRRGLRFEDYAMALHVSERTIHRWRAAGGLSAMVADRVCAGIGTHAAVVWPVEWCAADTVDLDDKVVD